MSKEAPTAKVIDLMAALKKSLENQPFECECGATGMTGPEGGLCHTCQQPIKPKKETKPCAT